MKKKDGQRWGPPRATHGQKPRDQDGQRHNVRETEAEGKSHGRPSREATPERQKKRSGDAEMREEEDVGDKQMRTWGVPEKHRGRDTKAKGEIRQTCRQRSRLAASDGVRTPGRQRQGVRGGGASSKPSPGCKHIHSFLPNP